MTDTPVATAAPSVRKAAEKSKLIGCMLLDDGSDVRLLKALRMEKGIIAANSFACRGISAVGSKIRGRRFPRPESIRTVHVVVPETRASEIFQFIYERAKIDQPGAGLMFQAPLNLFTPYLLPEGVEEEH
jgi:hypothetical protein